MARLTASCLALVAIIVPSVQATEGEGDFAWEQVAVGDNGDVYLLDRLGLEAMKYEEREVIKAAVKVTGYTGHPDLDEFFGVIMFDCAERSWRPIMAGGQRRSDGEFVMMPPPPLKYFNQTPEGSPLRLVADQVCEAE